MKSIGLVLTLGFLTTVAKAGLVVDATPISGSSHDFTKSGGYMGNGGTYLSSNKCSTCHASHKTAKNDALWGRSLAAGGNWTVWNGQTGRVLTGINDGTYLADTEFAQTGSAMCLSCHDGVTAIGGTVAMATTYRGNWGRNLSNMHPIAKKVPFNTAGWQQNLTTGNGGSGSNVEVDVVSGASFVGCTSCHSMHGSALSKILRGGEQCLSCHDR